MAEPNMPDTATLRTLAAKHGLDPRTIAKAIAGKPVKGARTQEAAAAAVAEWKKMLKRKAKVK